MKSEKHLREDAMLDGIQRHAFEYFTNEANLQNGLVRDKTAENWPSSIAAVGMALSAYPIGVTRNHRPRAEALERTLTTPRFFARSEQSREPDATGYRGFYHHFLDMNSGKRALASELSSIDTALLMAGGLCAGAVFDQDPPQEAEVRGVAQMLYDRVDWQWMLAGKATLCHGWTPEEGFLPFHWQAYDEALILYILALGSTSHGIGPESYAAWTAAYDWQTVEGIASLHASLLFIHQLSHAWIDFRGLRDDFMCAHDSDYFRNSAQAAYIQQRYAICNPCGFEGYGEFSWGITASDGPGERNPRPLNDGRTYQDYVARGVPRGPDDGTLAPWAVVASLPFAPEIVIPTLESFMQLQLHLNNFYGFKASFNGTYAADRRPQTSDRMGFSFSFWPQCRSDCDDDRELQNRHDLASFQRHSRNQSRAARGGFPGWLARQQNASRARQPC